MTEPAEKYASLSKEVLGMVRQALELYPDACAWLPVAPLVKATRRAGPIAGQDAAIEVAVPDALVQNLKGETAQRDVLLLVRIPRPIADRLRASSVLVLPGQPGWRS